MVAKVKKWLQLLGMPLALCLLGRQIYVAHGYLAKTPLVIEKKFLWLAFFAMGGNQVFWAYLWHRTSHRLGSPASWRESLRAYFGSFLLKYIPGQIWMPLRLAQINQRSGTSTAASLTSFALVQLTCLLCTGMLIFLFGWRDWFLVLPGGRYLVVSSGIAAAVLFSLLYFMPDLVSRLPKFAQLGKSRGTFLGLFGLSFAGYPVAYVWYFFLFRAFFHLTSTQACDLVLIGSLSDAASYFMFFVPSGLGVKEWSGGHLLSLAFGFSLPQATAIALALRLFTSITDLFFTALFLIGLGFPYSVTHFRKRKSARLATSTGVFEGPSPT